MGSPPTVTGVLAVVLIFISSVFFLLILSPVPADMVSRQVVLSCICGGCVTGAPGHQQSLGHPAASRVSTVSHCSCLLWWSSWSSWWPEGREMVTTGTLDGLQSWPWSFLTAGWRERSCSSSPGRYSGWGWWSSPGLHSASVASTASLCPHCRRPSHSLWSWCRRGSSTPATALLWFVDWWSGLHMICFCGSQPARLRAWGRLPLSSSPIVFCLALCLVLTGAWSLSSCCSPLGLLSWAA